MNPTETKPSGTTPAPAAPSPESALQRQLNLMLLALVVLSGTLTVYLLRQVTYAKKDLNAIKGPATQLIQAFNRDKPGMDAFLTKLGEYGRTHPDFVPLLNQYQIPVAATPAPATSAPPAAKPAAAPATKPATPPKK